MGRKLIQDEEFKRLIPPLTPDEFIRLEDDIVAHGCLSPLIVWNDILLDGYNRLEICSRHRIPFQIKSLLLENRDAALSWICTHQIGRRNLSEENRRYILGKLYEVQKRINVRNPHGNNQYEKDKHVPIYESKYGLAKDIGDKFHVAHSTIEKYAAYSRAVDRVADVNPQIVPRILTGEVHIGMKNLVNLSKLSAPEIKAVTETVEQDGMTELGHEALFNTLIKVQDSLTGIPDQTQNALPAPTIKDIPVFDPDADVTSLTLTIPSWQSSIVRVKDNADMEHVSDKAKLALRGAFASLIDTIETMLDLMKEVKVDV